MTYPKTQTSYGWFSERYFLERVKINFLFPCRGYISSFNFAIWCCNNNILGILEMFLLNILTQIVLRNIQKCTYNETGYMNDQKQNT